MRKILRKGGMDEAILFVGVLEGLCGGTFKQ